MEGVTIPEAAKRARPWATPHTFHRPEGVAEEDCGALEVLVDDQAGQGTMAGRALRSHWRPTASELAVLLGGGTVELSIFGRGHPPVSMLVFPGDEPRRAVVLREGELVDLSTVLGHLAEGEPLPTVVARAAGRLRDRAGEVVSPDPSGPKPS